MNGIAKCLSCTKRYKYTNGSSSNLIKHLGVHGIYTKKCKRGSVTNRRLVRGGGGMKLLDKLPKNIQDKCDLFLCLWLCVEYHPFSTVESKLFREFMSLVQPRYQVARFMILCVAAYLILYFICLGP